MSSGVQKFCGLRDEAVPEPGGAGLHAAVLSAGLPTATNCFAVRSLMILLAFFLHRWVSRSSIVSKVTSGLTLGFQGYDGGSLLTRVIAMVTYAVHLTYSRAGYVRDNRSTCIKAPVREKVWLWSGMQRLAKHFSFPLQFFFSLCFCIPISPNNRDWLKHWSLVLVVLIRYESKPTYCFELCFYIYFLFAPFVSAEVAAERTRVKWSYMP